MAHQSVIDQLRRRLLTKAALWGLIEPFETLIRLATKDGRRRFFDPAEFAWTSTLETHWRAIQRELLVVLRDRDAIPNFQDLQAEQRTLTTDNKWKVFMFYAYGRRIEENCQRCPETAALLDQVPGLKTAFFSILRPHKHIPPHCGPYNGVLRYHLGLLIPRPATRCRLRVGTEVRHWEEGKSLIFDDTHEHEVWNDTFRDRVILFVDFVRPLPQPLALINALVIRTIGALPFIEDLLENERRLRLGAER